MHNEKRDFDKDAAMWDENPGRVKVANDIADAIINKIRLAKEMDVLDFGCGTGLLSLRLIPFVRSITGIDSSGGMLEVFKSKIEKQKIDNIQLNLMDLEKGDILSGAYHLIASSMTFHHIKDIQPLLQQFHQLLLPSGIVAIADLDLDEGKFHEDATGVFHDGFNRDKLRQEFLDAGFADIAALTVAKITKPITGGALKEFSIFLMTGNKNGDKR
jgi:2-polyprenyl-3-methyl-5-hydroxy-6-metoxy-1,4-benzoquinol methylase